jgi:hypothetical protein
MLPVSASYSLLNDRQNLNRATVAPPISALLILGIHLYYLFWNRFPRNFIDESRRKALHFFAAFFW